MDKEEKILRSLKITYQARRAPELSPYFEKRVMTEVRGAAAAAEDERFSARLFLRLSFVSLFAALMLNAAYEFSPLGDRSAIDNLAQFDPFEIGGDLDE